MTNQAPSLATAAAERLIAERGALAPAIADELYRRRPELLERYGSVGRNRCLEDMHFNLEHLSPAVGLADPSMFSRYILWVDDLLRARQVPTEDLRLSLQIMSEQIADWFPEEEASAVEPCIRAALEALEAR